MENEYENYLTIGEMARLMGIHAKFLRYYDQIGVLSPEKTDPKTGYRYYEQSQIDQAQVIRMCIEAGIPLQSSFAYDLRDADGMRRLLDDAERLAQEELCQLYTRLRFIEDVRNTLARGEHLRQEDVSVEQKMAARRYLTHPIPQNVDTRSLYRAFSRIHARASELGWHTGCYYGKIYIFDQDSGRTTRLAFIDILEGEGDVRDVLSFPETPYVARRFPECRIEDAAQLFPELFSRSARRYVFESRLAFSSEGPLFELRCALENPFPDRKTAE